MTKVDVTDDEFVKELYSLVRKYCWKNRCYSEDLVQDLITIIVDKIDQFDSEKAEFSTWVYAVCNNKRLMLLRKENAIKRKSNVNTISLNNIVDDQGTESVDLLIDDNDTSSYYKKVIVDLVYSQLSDMTKKYFDGVNQVDIAKECGMSQANVSRKVKKEINEFKKKFELEGK